MRESLMEPLLISGPTTRRLLSIANTKYHDLKNKGLIQTVKVGNRTMVVYASVKKLAEPTT